MIHDVVLSDGTRIRRGEEDSNPIDYTKRLYEQKIKYMKMADMKLEGKTYQEIGNKYSLTRQRIEQILHKYFPDIQFPNQSGRFKRITNTIKFKCKSCKKIKILLAFSTNKKRIYCDNKCRLEHSNPFGNKRLPIPISKMTKKQYKEYFAKKANKWYHRHNHLPEFKEIIRQRNKKQKLKRKQKRNESRKIKS